RTHVYTPRLTVSPPTSIPNKELHSLQLEDKNNKGVLPPPAYRHPQKSQLYPPPAAPRHFRSGTRQSGGSHVLNPDDAIRFHQLQTGFQKQLFSKRVSDLNRGPTLFLLF